MAIIPERSAGLFVRDDDEDLFSRDINGQLVRLDAPTQGDYEKQVTLHATLPAGWSQNPQATVYPVAAHDSYAIQLTISTSATQKGTWQTLTWTADSGGQSLGTVTLRVDVVSNGLPQ